jgi:hypothetical protein
VGLSGANGIQNQKPINAIRTCGIVSPEWGSCR